jgi:hypothetical protein
MYALDDSRGADITAAAAATDCRLPSVYSGVAHQQISRQRKLSTAEFSGAARRV